MEFYDDSIDRIHARLVEKGKYQMEQTLILQDDEIKRLRERIKVLKSKMLVKRDKMQEKIEILRSDREDLKNKIAITHESTRNTHRLVTKKFIKAKEEMIKQHNKELKLISEQQTKSASVKIIHDNSIQHIRATIEKIQAELVALNAQRNEQYTERSKIIEQEIIRLKEEAKTSKQRLENLTEKYNSVVEKVNSRRKKHKTRIQSIQSKIDDLNEEINEIRQQYDEKVKSCIIQENVFNLDEIRKSITLANDLKNEIASRIKIMQENFQIEYSRAQEKLNRLKSGLEEHNEKEEAFKHDYANEMKLHRSVQKKLKQLDPELCSLREENVNLLRKLSLKDFQINGRNGNMQRFTELTIRETEVFDSYSDE